jgi:hypothetical protein
MKRFARAREFHCPCLTCFRPKDSTHLSYGRRLLRCGSGSEPESLAESIFSLDYPQEPYPIAISLNRRKVSM